MLAGAMERNLSVSSRFLCFFGIWKGNNFLWRKIKKKNGEIQWEVARMVSTAVKKRYRPKLNKITIDKSN